VLQEVLSRFSWYKADMKREEAEKKVRSYQEVMGQNLRFLAGMHRVSV